MSEIMVDIETLSTRPDAAILTIGAVKFSRREKLGKLEEMDTFYRRIKNENIGHADPETMKWWTEQSKEAQYEVMGNPDRVPLAQALQELRGWARHCSTFWANSPSFDCVILENAYKVCGMRPPWEFWATRDVRTVMDLGGVKSRDLPEAKVQHHALHDAYRQVIGVKKSLKNLGL